jgi:hypothetical protein
MTESKLKWNILENAHTHKGNVENFTISFSDPISTNIRICKCNIALVRVNEELLERKVVVSV